ncbi:MAG: TRAP transporter large permease [Alphaproteobacteria bacterium]|nr:TRAP transporter large permease [Alphaproteobacteria bacterium]
MPIALAMLLAGGAGYALMVGVGPLLSVLKTQLFYQFLNYDLAVIPLFLLMGNIAARAGLSAALFRAASAWLGHFRGGVAMATIGGCAGFATVCGSSLATAATIAQVALPELRRKGYSGALSTGALAAGGTLGILIPPSFVLIVAAVIVEANIETLFQAALLPGLIAAGGYLGAIAVTVRRDPMAGPPSERVDWSERWASLIAVWPVMVLFTLVIGGIYFGWFTPNQAAAVGVIAALLHAWMAGKLDFSGLLDAFTATAGATAMIFIIVFGAGVFAAFLGFTRLSFTLAQTIEGAGLAPIVVLALMILLFLALGCVMDSLSMILLFMPIFWPILKGLGFGLGPEELKVWISILVLMVVEVGLITPPVGLNVFVINALARDVPMSETFRGVTPFLLTDLARILLLVAFPGVTLLLPRLLG